MTRELGKRERTLQQTGIVGSFINTQPWSYRRFESPDSRPEERPPVAQCRVSHALLHSLPCYESPAHLASTQRPSLLLAVCYVLGRVSRSAFLVVVGDVSAVGCLPGRVHLLYSHNTAFERWSWNAICVCEDSPSVQSGRCGNS